MHKPRILVTGGLGFIGSHTVVELQQAGFDVMIADDLSNSALFILDRITTITGSRPGFQELNLLDKGKLFELFSTGETFDAVIHFAAFKSVAESQKEPLKYYHNNLLSLLHLLECMEETGVRNLVFSSSATVYGQPDRLPVDETAAFKKALSAYGSSKQMGETILEKTAEARAIRAIALRYFNPAGAHPSGLIGELPLGVPNNLMPYLTQTAAGIREILTVYGKDYDTPDGTCLRDYIHVVDLARAHVKSCERLLGQMEGSGFEVFNIGTGRPFSVLELIHAFEQHNELKLHYRIGERRPGDAAAVYADVTKAEKELAWKAELDIKDMVSTAWNWQKTLN